ncbi:MAG: ribbon-helix-helix protein, CopG family [Methylorubrum rhodinum]|uniref:ribbon-helix-helix protein, CopG family n=1 Tax=Methylorubrum rhodinum TaxID=29428 RepID=UPI003BB0345E
MNRQPNGVRRTTIRLCPDLLRRLGETAAAQRVSRSHLIDRLLRRGVEAATATEEKA